MGDPTTDRPYLELGQETLRRHLDAIPEGKRGALVIGFERSGSVLPSLQIGTAWKINGNWAVGADARLQKKAKPTTRFYTAISW